MYDLLSTLKEREIRNSRPIQHPGIYFSNIEQKRKTVNNTDRRKKEFYVHFLNER